MATPSIASGRRVGAEVPDPPAAVAQREGEAEQPEVVALLRRARDDRPRPHPGVPPARERVEAARDDGGREVLLADRDRAARPEVAEVVEEGQDRLAQHGVEGVAREQTVDDSSARASSRPRSAARSSAERPTGRGRRDVRGGAVARGAGRVARRKAGRDGGGVAALDVAEHLAHARLVGRGVEALARPRALRPEHAVAPLPRPKDVRRHADAAAQLPDAEAGFARRAPRRCGRAGVVHGLRGYFLNNPLTSSGQAVQLGA